MHFYMHSYLHKNFILVKSGCYRRRGHAIAIAIPSLKTRALAFLLLGVPFGAKLLSSSSSPVEARAGEPPPLSPPF
jgi:hypothetical protein